MTATLTSLKHAEAALVSTISSTVDHLDAVGTTDVEQALLRLEHAADAARARLSAAVERVKHAIGTLTADVAEMAHGLAEALSVGEQPATSRSDSSGGNGVVANDPAPVVEAYIRRPDVDLIPEQIDLGRIGLSRDEVDRQPDTSLGAFNTPNSLSPAEGIPAPSPDGDAVPAFLPAANAVATLFDERSDAFQLHPEADVVTAAACQPVENHDAPEVPSPSRKARKPRRRS